MHQHYLLSGAALDEDNNPSASIPHDQLFVTITPLFSGET